MRKRINKTITIIVSITIIVFSIISVAAITTVYFDKSKENIESVARISVEAARTPAEISEYVKSAVKEDIRITFVDKSGNVVFDNKEDPEKMENHSERKEIRDAFLNGEGSETRVSETLGKSTYYFALQFNGGVIRFSAPISNIYSVLFIIVPLFVLICVIMLVITTIVSRRMSRSFMKPITDIVSTLDVKNGIVSESDIEIDYEELKPIVENIKYISARLQKYIRHLKREKARVTLITNNMVEGMILIDAEGNILSVNQSAKAILNSNFEMGDEPKKIYDLTRNDTITSMLQTMKTEHSAYNTIAVGERFYHIYMNRSEYAGSYGIIILLIDATQSVNSEKIRHDFSANVTHELKTPLTTIKGFGEMLENKIITNPDEVSKYGGIIFRESERLLQLINDIIRLSEIEENSKEFETVNLKKISDEVIEILSHKAVQNEVTLINEADDISVIANGGYMSELLINLIDNAIKYNVTGGFVRLKITDSGSYATLIIEDNGIGIPKESQERIFERFYRVDKSRSKQTGGTGLGLSIVKHIVTYHNGSIKLISDIGKGTKIIIALPKLQQ